MKKDKYVITGGFGFMGYYLVSYLLHLQRSVIVLGRKPKGELKVEFDKLEKKYGDRFESIEGDIDEEMLHHLVHSDENIVGVYHLAAKKTTTRSTEFSSDIISHNGALDELVFNFCEDVVGHRDPGDKRGCKLIYVSTGEVYGRLFNMVDHALTENLYSMLNPSDRFQIYPFSKLAGEMVLINGGWNFEWDIVRVQSPYGIYMPENMLFPKLMIAAVEANIKGSGVFDLSAGNDSRPFVYIGDVVIGLGHVMGKAKSGEIYNLAGDSVYLSPVISMFAETYAPNMVLHINRDAEATHRRVDCSKIKKDNLWEPIVLIESGMKMMFEYYKNKALIEQSMKKIGL